MSVKKSVNREGGILKSPGSLQIKTLIDTALGKIKADTGVQEAREQVRAAGAASSIPN